MEESLCDSELWQLIEDDEAFPLQPLVPGETPTDETDGDFSGKSGTDGAIHRDREL
jgi:hypothetical protein